MTGDYFIHTKSLIQFQGEKNLFEEIVTQKLEPKWTKNLTKEVRKEMKKSESGSSEELMPKLSEKLKVFNDRTFPRKILRI